MIQHLIPLLSNRQKTITVVIFDAVFSALCFYLSVALRLGNMVPLWNEGQQFWHSIVVVTVIQSICFYVVGLYRGIWRFASIPDLIRLAKGVTVAVALSLMALFFLTRLEFIPRTTFVIDWLLLVCTLGGMRFTYRIWRDHTFTTNNRPDALRVIIVGAGAGGEQLFRELREDSSLSVKVVAFVDDDLGKRNKILHGVHVMGGIGDLGQIIAKTHATEIYIAIPSASGDQIRRIVDACKHNDIKFKTLPRLKDFIRNKTEFSQLRDIGLEDLLGRQEVHLDGHTLGAMLTDKVVMVTGAGGSIGSEICLQIAQFRPFKLVFLEMTEFFLFQLERKFSQMFPDINIVPVIGDIRNAATLDQVFSAHRPQVVFHAAAYKHVPLMELNPREAIKTNVMGTKLLVEAASKYKVERFVQVSTDKAVNPTNIMGASKRMAEMIVQHAQASSSTKFMTVRFGNVLGSSGSVIPIFEEQLKNGGPLKVTHPEIKRYFMSIPEASQLVLQAGAIGSGGEIFVLDMGQPVKIADLATQMIRLAGLRPGIDIKIEYTGLRPGEKLFEELFVDDEHTLPTLHPLVRVAKARSSGSGFKEQMDAFIQLGEEAGSSDIVHALQSLIPEYRPDTRIHDLQEKSEQAEEVLAYGANVKNLQ